MSTAGIRGAPVTVGSHALFHLGSMCADGTCGNRFPVHDLVLGPRHQRKRDNDMPTQAVVLLWTAIACFGLGVITILATSSVNRAFRGGAALEPVTVSRSERTLDPPKVRGSFDAQSKN